MLNSLLKKTKEKRAHFSVFTVVCLVVLCVYCIMLLSLLLWALLTALKEPLSFNGNRVGLPDPWYFGNFRYVIENAKVEKLINGQRTEISFFSMVFNSVLYAVGGAFFNTLVPCITAYLCARYRYKFSRVVYGAVLVVMIIPVVGSLASEVQTAITFGIFDHVWGLWIMKANFLGLYFLVFHETFRSMPDAYTEAATIDGAGNWGVMLRIALPLARNTFFTVLLINFVTLWNDFQTPMVYLPTHPTISEHLYWIKMSGSGLFSRTPVQMAASLMLLLPVLILFLCFHKRLLGNLTIGGVKG